MDEEEASAQYGNEEPVKESSATLEAFPAHERVKADILNLQAAVDYNLFEYIKASTYRDKRRKNRLSDKGRGALEYWKNFQTSVLILYKKLKPHIAIMEIPPETKTLLKKLDLCYINLLKGEEEVSPTEWREVAMFFDDVIFKMGVSKIELDKREMQMRNSILDGTT